MVVEYLEEGVHDTLATEESGVEVRSRHKIVSVAVDQIIGAKSAQRNIVLRVVRSDWAYRNDVL